MFWITITIAAPQEEPQQVGSTEVVMLVKKNYQKDIKLLSNYRLISLTNTMYKV